MGCSAGVRINEAKEAIDLPFFIENKIFKVKKIKNVKVKQIKVNI